MAMFVFWMPWRLGVLMQAFALAAAQLLSNKRAARYC
jgi:hypothetical protein